MKSCILLCIFFFSTVSINFSSADPDSLQDTCPAAPTGKNTAIFINGLPCKNQSTITASDFKTTKLKEPGDTDNFYRSALTLVSAFDFPGLNTLGLSIARTDLDVDGSVLPHSHPRATEMVFVAEGVVIAGFLDTSGNYFQEVLRTGDVFVFPRGLLHVSFNVGFKAATLYSVFNCQNPGVVGVNDAVFEPNMDMIDTIVKNFRSGEDRIRNVTFSSSNP